jgi:hypothetical protein
MMVDIHKRSPSRTVLRITIFGNHDLAHRTFAHDRYMCEKTSRPKTRIITPNNHEHVQASVIGGPISSGDFGEKHPLEDCSLAP